MPPTDKGMPNATPGHAPPRWSLTTLVSPWWAVFLLSVSALAWAGNYVMGRWVAGAVPPGGLALGRWVVATLVLLPLAWPHLQRDLPAIVARWRYLLFMGLIGGATFGTLQYAGLQFTTATNGGLIGAMSPLLISLAGAALFGDRLSWRQWAGLALSLSGAVTIVAKGDLSNLAALRLNIGDLMILATLVAWAVYSAMLRLRPAMHWTSFTFVVFAVALAGNVPVAVVEHLSGSPLLPTWPAVISILYTGLASSAVGFIAWNRGVEIVGSQRAGLFLNLIPVLSVALAFLLLGERLEVYHAVACLLVFGGLALALSRVRDKR